MDNSFNFKHVYPHMRHCMAMGRNVYGSLKGVQSRFIERHSDSAVVPNTYDVCNTNTIDSQVPLNVLSGELPQNIDGNLYICQCLGTPGAFMVGDTNIVKMKFNSNSVTMKNKLMWSPVAIARMALAKTKHRFDYFGLMFLSPGLGMCSYTEGMYLLPDGRLGITSDVDRPWIIERDSLRPVSPLGKRKEWLPMMKGSAGDAMGNLFSGYSNSHVIYTDTETKELFLVSYQYEQADKTHPCHLMKWDGKDDFKQWAVVDEDGQDIRIMQSIHELIFTRDYILLADTAFVAGMEMLTPWKNAPLPNKNTVVYIVDRREMTDGNDKVVGKRIEIEEACIHLIADYENTDDKITVYMLHTPATNTAEIIKSYDTDMNGKLFSDHITGYGTLPVLDLSSVGKHIIDMKEKKTIESRYITDEKFCWGPYMYTYMGRQTEKFQDQDLYVMFKGFSKDMLPKRIYEAYKDVDNRRVPIEKMVGGNGLSYNNSVARIKKDTFEIVDSYILPDKVLLYTISCLEATDSHPGYLIAGIVQDIPDSKMSSGHEYWLFKADDLASGPVCKLGSKDINNSVLFHTVYISSKLEAKLDENQATYNIDLKEDYPKEELALWDDSVLKTFEDLIYPYYNKCDKTENAERVLEDFATKRIRANAGKEYLIAEEEVVDGPAHAQRMIAEANRMFKTTGWKVECDNKILCVESKAVSGDFEKAGVLVTRSSGVIKADGRKFFEYMTSPKGYAVIDPVSDPDDHEKEPLERYQWGDGRRLEAAVTTTNIKGLPPSDFVVLNAIDTEELIFASKSILHNSMPGGSKYSSAGQPENGRERAINTFVIKVVPIDENSCKVMCINYADMGGKTNSAINNFINTKAFFPPLYSRMIKASKEI